MMKIEYYNIDNGWIVETDSGMLFDNKTFRFFKSKNMALAWIRQFLKRRYI